MAEARNRRLKKETRLANRPVQRKQQGKETMNPFQILRERQLSSCKSADNLKIAVGRSLPLRPIAQQSGITFRYVVPLCSDQKRKTFLLNSHVFRETK